MPSLNYPVKIRDDERVRINVCEGSVHLTHEERDSRGRWHGINGGHIGPLSRKQAEELSDAIKRGLANGF